MSARALAPLVATLALDAGARAQEAAPTGADARDAAPAGAAAEAERHVADGRRSYGELDFAASIEAMRRALAVPGVPPVLRLEALEYIGSSYVVLEQPREAREAFVAMLDLDPYHVVREPSGSPKIARFVEEVRASVVEDAALDPEVRLRPDLPRAGRSGRPTAVRFEAEGPARIDRVSVFVRGIDEPDWRRVAAERRDQRFVAEIPAREGPDDLELYAEGRDARGRVVTRSGEPLAPLTLPIRAAGAEPRPSLLSEWWLWAGIGAVIAAGLVVGLAVSSGESAPAGTLPPGRVELP